MAAAASSNTDICLTCGGYGPLTCNTCPKCTALWEHGPVDTCTACGENTNTRDGFCKVCFEATDTCRRCSARQLKWKLSANFGTCSDCAIASARTPPKVDHRLICGACGDTGVDLVLQVLPGPQWLCLPCLCTSVICNEQQAEPIVDDWDRFCITCLKKEDARMACKARKA